MALRWRTEELFMAREIDTDNYEFKCRVVLERFHPIFKSGVPSMMFMSIQDLYSFLLPKSPWI